MQSFSKFVQARNFSIFYFIDVVKACEKDLHRIYFDPITSYGYGDGIFSTFLATIDHTYDPLHMVWIAKPNFGVEYAWSQFFSRTYMVQKRDPLINCLNYIFTLDWLIVVEVK
jgi:hypothetical protein